MSVGDKDYDGIKYNAQDKPPFIFKLLYYGLWAWGLCFMGYFLFSGWSSHAEYAEIKKAKEARLATQRQTGSEGTTVTTMEERKSPELIAQGKKDFVTHCASCHGAEAKGGIGPDLTRKQFKYGRSAPEVTRTVIDGRPGGMPAFKNELSNKQIDGLVQYVLSL